MSHQGRFDFECDDPHCDECPTLDPPRAHRVTEKAVKRSASHAPPEVAHQMRLALMTVARRQSSLTSDDVWNEVGREAMKQWNPSALGNVFRQAAKDKTILLTDIRRESRRPAHHRKPLRVWLSLVYQAG